MTECPICKGVGYVRVSVPLSDPLFGKSIPCDCKKEEIRRKRQARALAWSNLTPEVLASCTFDSFNLSDIVPLPCNQKACQETDAWATCKHHGQPTPRCRWAELEMGRILVTCQEYAKAPKGWLVMAGARGCGKTHLALAIFSQVLGTGHTCFFATVPDLLTVLREGIHEEEYLERLEEIRSVDLLVLDDYGAENGTTWANEQLFLLVNYRVVRKMPTVVTTNDDPFRPKMMSSRVASRLTEGSRVGGLSKVIVFPCGDYRPKAGGAIL